MKLHLFKYAALLGMALLSLASCRKDNGPEVPKDNVEIKMELVEVGEGHISFSVSTKHAESFAWYCTSNLEEEVKSAEYVFSHGNEENATEESKTVTVEGLDPSTQYLVYAAVRNEFSEQIRSISASTTAAEVKKVLAPGDVSKTSLSYHVNSEPGRTYRHTYLEGWYFNHLLASAIENEGSEFDMNVFIWNLLASYGAEGTEPSEHRWSNDQENTLRNQEVTLYGGQSYYALFSYIEGETGWTGTPEYIEMTLPEAGSTTGEVNFTDETVSPERISVRMEFSDYAISYICYDLYKKDQYDAKFEGADEKKIKNFLYEYALHAGNTYTDSWTVEPGTEYVLAIMGVDPNGDSFLQTKVYTTPMPEPEFEVSLCAYNRELEGYYGYNTARADVTMKNFSDLNPDTVFATMMSKAQWDATCMAIFGEMSVDDVLATMPELMAYVVNTPLQEDEVSAIQDKGQFTRITPDLEPETEYIFAVLFSYNDKWYFKSATATLDAEPSGEADDAYKAFLGEWTVTGKTTKDWKSPLTYTIKVEQLTPNKSFKVSGWSESNAGKEFPFVAKYDASTKKIIIDGYQYLGKTTINGSEYEVRLMACLSYGGELYMSDYDGVIYKGSITDVGDGKEKISMFPEFFQKDGKYFEVQTMSYGFVKDGEIVGSPDEFDIVEFQITREKK